MVSLNFEICGRYFFGDISFFANESHFVALDWLQAKRAKRAKRAKGQKHKLIECQPLYPWYLFRVLTPLKLHLPPFHWILRSRCRCIHEIQPQLGCLVQSPPNLFLLFFVQVLKAISTVQQFVFSLPNSQNYSFCTPQIQELIFVLKSQAFSMPTFHWNLKGFYCWRINQHDTVTTHWSSQICIRTHYKYVRSWLFLKSGSLFSAVLNCSLSISLFICDLNLTASMKDRIEVAKVKNQRICKTTQAVGRYCF